MPDIPLSTFRGLIAVVDARRCWVMACVCLLAVAVGLRFYNLNEYALSTDGAKAANFSRGDLSEVLDNTRHRNSSPILYPLALWGVQKAASTEFSVRLLPAVASALTVGALLSLLPRVGVPRRAAFMAALLAALSVAAIEHAQDAREYSLDALVAALMIAGLLQYLRDGRRWLLCGALLAGPLLQYGLALFGVAVIGAAALVPAASAASSRAAAGGVGRAGVAAIWGRLRGRLDLLLPIACFAAACGVSWAVTLRYQWVEGGFGGGAYLKAHYYQGGFDAWAVVEFAVRRTWEMASYHMPPMIAGTALVAFAAVALAWLLKRRRRLDAVALLAALAVGLAICAALLSAYPLGGIRQNLYLGPIIFLAAGGAFHTVGVAAAAAMGRRAWRAGAFGGVVAVIALAGAAEIWRDDIGDDSIFYDNRKQALAALEELEREGDAVYVSWVEVPIMEFYKMEKPANYIYGGVYCRRSVAIPRDAAYWSECARTLMDEAFRTFKNGSRRIWFVYYKDQGVSIRREMAEYSREVMVEEVVGNGQIALYLITGMDELVANVSEYVESVEPDVAATYNLYFFPDNILYYAKRFCAPGDTESTFFLNIYPEYAADLSDARRGYGYDIVKFDFGLAGLWIDDKCVIRRHLPEYPIARIHTGQFVGEGSSAWEVDFPLSAKARFAMREAVISGEPTVVAAYDLYLQEDALHYVKRPCASSDVEARFFLHLYPEDVNDLPAPLRQYGLHNLDFEFHEHGLLAAGRCVIRRHLPEYPIGRIHTGQFVRPDGAVLWEAELPLGR